MKRRIYFPEHRRRGTRLIYVIPIVLIAASSLWMLMADAAQGPIYSVQEALRRENLLTTSPSGTLDEPTKNALRRFQSSRGLPESGEIDSATLEALERGNGQRPAIESLPSPSRTTAVTAEVAEADRAFLQRRTDAERRAEQMPPPASTELPVVSSAAPTTDALAPMAAPAPSTPSVVSSVTPTPQRIPPPIAEPPVTAVAPFLPPAAPASPQTVVEINRPEEKLRKTTSRASAPVAIAGAPSSSSTRTSRPTALPPPPPAIINGVPVTIAGPGGVRITRTTTTTPDGRRITTERRESVGKHQEPDEIMVRRAEPVEPQKKERKFFIHIIGNRDRDREHDDD